MTTVQASTIGSLFSKPLETRGLSDRRIASTSFEPSALTFPELGLDQSINNLVGLLKSVGNRNSDENGEVGFNELIASNLYKELNRGKAHNLKPVSIRLEPKSSKALATDLMKTLEDSEIILDPSIIQNEDRSEFSMSPEHFNITFRFASTSTPEEAVEVILESKTPEHEDAAAGLVSILKNGETVFSIFESGEVSLNKLTTLEEVEEVTKKVCAGFENLSPSSSCLPVFSEEEVNEYQSFLSHKESLTNLQNTDFEAAEALTQSKSGSELQKAEEGFKKLSNSVVTGESLNKTYPTKHAFDSKFISDSSFANDFETLSKDRREAQKIQANDPEKVANRMMRVNHLGVRSKKKDSNAAGAFSFLKNTIIGDAYSSYKYANAIQPNERSALPRSFADAKENLCITATAVGSVVPIPLANYGTKRAVRSFVSHRQERADARTGEVNSMPTLATSLKSNPEVIRVVSPDSDVSDLLGLLKFVNKKKHKDAHEKLADFIDSLIKYAGSHANISKDLHLTMCANMAINYATCHAPDAISHGVRLSSSNARLNVSKLGKGIDSKKETLDELSKFNFRSAYMSLSANPEYAQYSIYKRGNFAAKSTSKGEGALGRKAATNETSREATNSSTKIKDGNKQSKTSITIDDMTAPTQQLSALAENFSEFRKQSSRDRKQINLLTAKLEQYTLENNSLRSNKGGYSSAKESFPLKLLERRTAQSSLEIPKIKIKIEEISNTIKSFEESIDKLRDIQITSIEKSSRVKAFLMDDVQRKNGDYKEVVLAFVNEISFAISKENFAVDFAEMYADRTILRANNGIDEGNKLVIVPISFMADENGKTNAINLAGKDLSSDEILCAENIGLFAISLDDAKTKTAEEIASSSNSVMDFAFSPVTTEETLVLQNLKEHIAEGKKYSDFKETLEGVSAQVAQHLLFKTYLFSKPSNVLSGGKDLRLSNETSVGKSFADCEMINAGSHVSSMRTTVTTQVEPALLKGIGIINPIDGSIAQCVISAVDQENLKKSEGGDSLYKFPTLNLLLEELTKFSVASDICKGTGTSVEIEDKVTPVFEALRDYVSQKEESIESLKVWTDNLALNEENLNSIDSYLLHNIENAPQNFTKNRNEIGSKIYIGDGDLADISLNENFAKTRSATATAASTATATATATSTAAATATKATSRSLTPVSTRRSATATSVIDVSRGTSILAQLPTRSSTRLNTENVASSKSRTRTATSKATRTATAAKEASRTASKAKTTTRSIA